MIEISTNNSFMEEKKYIFEVIFNDFLGINYSINFVDSLNSFIIKSSNNNNEFKLPDLFFSKLPGLSTNIIIRSRVCY